jgi:hypothetical protein
MALTNIASDRLPPLSPVSFRNRLINGDFRIDQRNAGGQKIIANSSPTLGDIISCADRWWVAPSGNSVAGQRTSNSSGYFYTITGNTSITACYFYQRLEGNTILDILGQQATLSAKISSTTVTTLNVVSWYPNNTLDVWATAANNIAWLSATQISINTTPTVYSTTFTVNNSCVNGMTIGFATAGFTSGNLTFTDVQLELGSIASSFERMNWATQLQQCQRYYSTSYSYGTVAGTNVGGQGGGCTYIPQGTAVGQAGTAYMYPVTMRAPPTHTLYDNAGNSGKMSRYNAGWNNNDTPQATNLYGTTGFLVQSSATTGVAFSFDYTARAEL